MDDRAVLLVDVRAGYAGERRATLRGVSLSATLGEQLAITGPNGAGKTTILEVTNGLLPVASGTVTVFGQPVTQRSHRLRREIAYVPQNLFFNAETPFLVSDVVLAARFGRIGPWRLPDAYDRLRARMSLDAVGMSELGGRPIGRLSGGQQRKVLLARALAQEARLLLLDEPTANLDPDAKEEIADIVAAVRDELVATSIVVSHESGSLLSASDRVVTVDGGRIVAPCVAGAA